LERLLREELRRQRVDRLFEAADRLAALPLPALTEAEIEAEIQAVRLTETEKPYLQGLTGVVAELAGLLEGTAIAEFASQHAGTHLDLDPALEQAGIEAIGTQD
jgi:hypothetical protein